MTEVRVRTVHVDGVAVFYCEAGDRSNPTALLLHGFPSSSHMFRDLISLLADRFHLVAPDLPGFGQTKTPPRGAFDYMFDRLADHSTRPNIGPYPPCQDTSSRSNAGEKIPAPRPPSRNRAFAQER